MKSRHLILVLALLAAATCLSQESDPPVVDGYVTRVASPSDFDVNGIHIRINGKTRISPQAAKGTKPYIGQAVRVDGKYFYAAHAIDAAHLVFCQQKQRKIAGSGISLFFA